VVAMREEKRIERYERILAAASVVFGRFGYRRSSLTDVAREAGIGKSTIYHYVAGKEELFAALANGHYARYVESVSAALALETSAVGRLRRYAEVALEFHTAARENVALPDEVREEDFPEVAKHVRRFGELELATISEILEGGVKCGEFRALDLPAASSIVLAVIKGMVVAECRDPGNSVSILTEGIHLLTRGLLCEGGVR
jgi:AcrR family transcriptional regulator